MSVSAARQSWQISAPARSQPAHRVGDNASSASRAARSANGSNSSANGRAPAPCRRLNLFRWLFKTQPSLRSVAGRVVDSALWYPDAIGVRRVKSARGRYSPASGCGAAEDGVEPSPPFWRGLRERRRRRRFWPWSAEPSPPRSSRGSRSSRAAPREALAAAPPPSPGRRRVTLTSPSET